MAKLVAILNTTPDSFYDGGKYVRKEKAIERAIEFEKIGVDIIDVGGESTRPSTVYGGSGDPLPIKEELNRVIPIINALKKEISTPISIDTYKPQVAEKAIEMGASIINDVTGLKNKDMQKLVKDSGCKAIVMHMLGNPKTMQKNPFYPNGVIKDLLQFFQDKIEILLDSGIKKEQIILDPGIGFGKTVSDNLQILSSINTFKQLGHEILVGASRKSFLGKILKKTPDQLLPATLAIHTITLMGGVDYIRVHDAKEHKDIIDLLKNIEKINGPTT